MRATVTTTASAASRPITAPRFIQHKSEAFWFYRYLSIVYDSVVNPPHWNEEMREKALVPAQLAAGQTVVDVGGGTVRACLSPTNIPVLSQRAQALKAGL